MMNNGGKYILLRNQNKLLSLLFQNNRLRYAGAEEVDGGIVGTIYIGKIKNIVQNIQAAFVETAPGVLCFLPLSELSKKAVAEDELLLQISKDGVKTKQPIATTKLSLNGKYAVVTLGRPGLSFSTKLSEKSRLRLSQSLKESPLLQTDVYGIVIRTNAKELEDVSPLIEEIVLLQEEMQRICSASQTRTCYSVLYRKPPQYISRLRDFPKGFVEEIITDDAAIYEEVKLCREEQPSFFLPPIRFYEDSMLSLSKLYGVETKLSEALAKKVWLKSGGYLVIEPTEALTVIDVNTGKVTGKKTTEETFFRMNMEAAEEIALQLVLRNLSGILIIDFINMNEASHKEQLLQLLSQLLQKDMVKCSKPQMTSLGLVEFTRMKTNKPLAEQLAWNGAPR